MYTLILIQLRGRESDKIIFTQPIPGNKRVGKEPLQCHRVSPSKTFNNRWQYFVIECMCGSYLPSKILKVSPQENEKPIRNFQHYLEIESLSSPKRNEKLYSCTFFLDIWLQKLSYTAAYIIKWLKTYFLVNAWENQKYLFIKLFTHLPQMKLSLFAEE